jgi:hypothetical protein
LSAARLFFVGEELEQMDAQQTVRMNPGEGETSYARNSTFQVRLLTELVCHNTKS